MIILYFCFLFWISGSEEEKDSCWVNWISVMSIYTLETTEGQTSPDMNEAQGAEYYACSKSIQLNVKCNKRLLCKYKKYKVNGYPPTLKCCTWIYYLCFLIIKLIHGSIPPAGEPILTEYNRNSRLIMIYVQMLQTERDWSLSRGDTMPHSLAHERNFQNSHSSCSKHYAPSRSAYSLLLRHIRAKHGSYLYI